MLPPLSCSSRRRSRAPPATNIRFAWIRAGDGCCRRIWPGGGPPLPPPGSSRCCSQIIAEPVRPSHVHRRHACPAVVLLLSPPLCSSYHRCQIRMDPGRGRPMSLDLAEGGPPLPPLPLATIDARGRVSRPLPPTNCCPPSHA